MQNIEAPDSGILACEDITCSVRGNLQTLDYVISIVIYCVKQGWKQLLERKCEFCLT